MLLKLSQLILLFDVVFDTLLYKLFFIKELKTSQESCFFFHNFYVFANQHETRIKENLGFCKQSLYKCY